MAWKIEKWFEEVFPGKDNIFTEYHKLPARELVIICAAVIDVALAELISLRLRKDQKEIEEFIGADGDGRAPLGSLGSKIQLAYLLLIISKSDAEILRIIKNLRNIFAHRVNVDFNSELVVKQLQKLVKEWENISNKLNPRLKNDLSYLTLQLGKENEAGEGLLLAVFCVYQAYFTKIREIIIRIPSFKNSEKE